jgi:hypothetical protein
MEIRAKLKQKKKTNNLYCSSKDININNLRKSGRYSFTGRTIVPSQSHQWRRTQRQSSMAAYDGHAGPQGESLPRTEIMPGIS